MPVRPGGFSASPAIERRGSRAQFHSPKLEKFLPSVDAHFRKSIDYVVLDTRYMTSEQRKTLMEYINVKWKSEKHRLIILPRP